LSAFPVAMSFVGGYLIGSIPIGLLVSRWYAGIDIRRFGTGNIGASNVLHNLGSLPAAIVGVGSFLQGVLPAIVAWRLAGSTALGAAAAGSVVGYAWSIFLRFRGGRAVATATGGLAILSPVAWPFLLALYAVGGLLHAPGAGVFAGMVAYLAIVILVLHSPAATAAIVIVLVVLLKRLDGIGADLNGRGPTGVVVDRLIFDRRPGQRLVGPRSDTRID